MRKITENQISKMKELQDKGKYPTEIGRKLGLPTSVIRYWLLDREKNIKRNTERYRNKSEREKERDREKMKPYQKEYHRNRYQTDPEFRERQRRSSRESYWKRRQ